MRFPGLGHLRFGRNNADHTTCTDIADNVNNSGFLALVGLARKANGAEDRAAMEAALQAGLQELEAQRQWYASEAQQACWKKFDFNNIWNFNTDKGMTEGDPLPCDLDTVPLELGLGPIWALKDEECKVWACRRTTTARGHVVFVLEEAD